MAEWCKNYHHSNWWGIASDDSFMINTWKYASIFSKQSGAVGACWAHNPEVDGSKPSSARNFFTKFFGPFPNPTSLPLYSPGLFCKWRVRVPLHESWGPAEQNLQKHSIRHNNSCLCHSYILAGVKSTLLSRKTNATVAL